MIVLLLLQILVTGSGDFLGSHVQNEIERRGFEFRPFDLPESSVTNSADIDHALKGVDGVINLAGILGTAETFGEEAVTAEINILGAINVAAGCRSSGIPLVQVGTGHKGQPNPYAITKACAEDLVLAMGGETNVVRAYHVYGPGQKPSLPHGPHKVRKIIPSFVCRALTDMPIEINGCGEQLIDLVYAEDVARVLVGALSEPFGRTVEAGTGNGVSVNDVAHNIRENVGAVDLVYLPMRQGEPVNAVVVAQNPVCYNSFPYGMEETVAYYSEYIQNNKQNRT